MSDEMIINTAQFEELKGLLEDDFEDLIHTYMVDSETRLKEMQEAYDSNDNRKGFEAAHSLKGASANLGAPTLTALCYQLQEACRDNNIASQHTLIEEIVTHCRQVNEKIHTLLAKK